MPAYSYTAINQDGAKKKGILSAESEREARKLVKDLKLTPLKVSESKDLGKTLKIKDKDIVIMTRQLATLLEASTPIVEALTITANQLQNKNLVYILYSLKEDIVQGKRLGSSMKKFPGVFSDTYISMVTAGDSSGNLDIVFNKLADYLEESASIKQKVISALTYPLILIGFSIVVIISLLAFVLPQVVGQFIKAGAELPFITKFLIGISNNIIPILIVIVISISIIFFSSSSSKVVNNIVAMNETQPPNHRNTCMTSSISWSLLFFFLHCSSALARLQSLWNSSQRSHIPGSPL